MKRFYTLLLLSVLWAGAATAQKATTVAQAIHYIKLANTLREVDKSEESINLLKRALPTVKGKHAYWEAVTNELLGLSYNDLDNHVDALRYLQIARGQYAKLKYVASGWAVNEVIRDISGKNVYAGIQIGTSDIKLAIFKTKYESEFYEKDIKTVISVPDVALVADASKTFRAGQDALRTCIDSIRRYDIPSERIFVVLSREASEGLARSPESKKKLYNELMSALPGGNIRIDTTLTANREAELFTVGSIPRKVWPTTSALEIGTNSTIGGYFDDKKVFHAINVPVGINTLVNRIDTKRNVGMDAYRRDAQRVIKAVADSALTTRFTNDNRGLQQRRTVGVGGDIALALVTYLHPEKAELAAVAITPDDVERFRKLALNDYKTLTQPELGGITDPAVRSRVEKDLGALQDRVNEKQLIAGALWLESVMKVYANSALPKRFVFIRDAEIGWVTGKFLETINFEYESTIAKGALYTR